MLILLIRIYTTLRNRAYLYDNDFDLVCKLILPMPKTIDFSLSKNKRKLHIANFRNFSQLLKIN